MNFKNIKIGILGMGYVGLPLAVEFSKNFKTLGFDINATRIKQLKNGVDETKEILKKDLIKAKNQVINVDLKIYPDQQIDLNNKENNENFIKLDLRDIKELKKTNKIGR